MEVYTPDAEESCSLFHRECAVLEARSAVGIIVNSRRPRFRFLQALEFAEAYFRMMALGRERGTWGFSDITRVRCERWNAGQITCFTRATFR
jgi:hypothetical protein